MPHSLERRWASLVESYARLKDLYERSIQHRKILSDELRDANAEIRQLKRDQRERERAAKGSLGKLIAAGRYNAVHLRDAGDIEGATKIDIWLDEVEESMSPVADVAVLIELLEGWVAAVPYDDDKVSSLYMRTLGELNGIRGSKTDD